MPASTEDRATIHRLMDNLNLRPNRNGTKDNSSNTTSPRSSDSHLANFRSHRRKYKEGSRGERDRVHEQPKKSSFKKFFRRADTIADERRQDTLPPQTTPQPERQTEDSSREPREPRRVRFQEDVDAIVPEICDLIDLRTASPTHFLRLLATLPSNLHEVHRRTLLRAAGSAVGVAYGEFTLARSAAARQWTSDKPSSNWMFRIPFADVRDFKGYVNEVNEQAENLNDSMRGFGFFDVAEPDCRRAMESVRISFGRTVPGSAETEMDEIRWAVERKCMYWAAVTMMKARIGEDAHAAGSWAAQC